MIVGLRNPGQPYSKTRHNAGCWFVEAVAGLDNLSFKNDLRIKGEFTAFTVGNDSCFLFLPASFMNASGECVRAVCNFYKILPSEILVAHDDLDLLPGVVRLKTGGGHAGHNGLRDIITHLQSNAFHRLRLGVGHPGHRDLVVDYVLGKPAAKDRELIDAAITRAIDILPVIVIGDFATAMQKLHI